LSRIFRGIFYISKLLSGLEIMENLGRKLDVKNLGFVRIYPYLPPFTVLLYYFLFILFNFIIKNEGLMVPWYMFPFVINSAFVSVPTLMVSFTIFLWTFSFLFENFNTLVQEQISAGSTNARMIRETHGEFCNAVSTIAEAFGLQVNTWIYTSF